MAAQLGLPAALRARGLTVEVVPGWETRSAGSFGPRAALSHWTAGPAGTLKRPSLSICTYGRSDLPGPLCNVYLDRNGVAVVVAAGRANHAGAGSWRGITGNSSFFGTECEAAGPNDFTKAQRWAYPRVNAAFCDLGGFGADMVAGHSEYATPKGRKQDINGYTMDDMRADVRSLLAGKTPTSPLQEDDMSAKAEQQIQFLYDAFTSGGPSTPYGLSVLELVRRLPADTAHEVWNGVYVNRPDSNGAVQRVPVIQELADAKTQSAAAAGELAGALSALAAAQSGGSVDLAAVKQAAREGAQEALAGGVKVTVDVPGAVAS